jgi:hypothetical protein
MMAAMVAARTFLGLIPEIAAGISVYLLAGWAVGLRAALRATPV